MFVSLQLSINLTLCVLHAKECLGTPLLETCLRKR